MSTQFVSKLWKNLCTTDDHLPSKKLLCTLQGLKLHPLRFQIIELNGRNEVIVRYLEDKLEREEERSIKRVTLKCSLRSYPKI